jgi:hypothetical protein
MDHQSELHKLRQKLALARQRGHASALGELQSLLAQMGLKHPYALSDQQIDSLMNVPDFASGGAGPFASESDREFVYRISGIRKVVKFTDWFRPFRLRNDDDIWNELKSDFDAPEWLRLDNYARGALSGPRRFTWWTDLDVLSTNIICGAHSMGLPNDWVSKYSLIMRCPIAAIPGRDVRVPTVIDAFDSEVFHPTVDANLPTSGIAISLDGAGPLSTGAREFVLLDIDVRQIEFQPILIDQSIRDRHLIELDANFRTRLQSYYRGL